MTTLTTIATYANRTPVAVGLVGLQVNNDLAVVCVWAFVGLMLSIFVVVSDFGLDLATVLAVAE